MKLTEKQEKLLQFVKECHGDQVRKYTGEPYWKHVERVGYVAHYCKVPLGFEIGICHDLFEDTNCIHNTLFSFTESIGYLYSESCEICDGVKELTDVYTKEAFPKVNRERRKDMERVRLGLIDADIQTIKYADLIDNTSSIVKHDPSFAKIYLKEKKELLKAMRNGDFDLYLEACHILLKGLESTNI